MGRDGLRRQPGDLLLPGAKRDGSDEDSDHDAVPGITQTIHEPLRGEVREEVSFFGRGPEKMFGSVHLPRGTARAGVLICSPFQSEFLANYRREVRLARALAGRQLAVGRFHYRGTGHSDGAGKDVTFGSMCEDAEEAASWLCDRSGVEDLGFLGTRWGALIAAAVAAQTAGAPVALWDPTIDGTRYFEEVFRFRQMSTLSHGRSAPRKGLFDEMEEAGYVDVFGFTIDRAILESSRDRELAAVLGSTPRSVLLVQVDTEKQLKDEYEDLVRLWNQEGFSIDVRLISGQEAWWFPGTQWQESTVRRSEMMVADTADWFSEQLARTVRG